MIAEEIIQNGVDRVQAIRSYSNNKKHIPLGANGLTEYIYHVVSDIENCIALHAHSGYSAKLSALTTQDIEKYRNESANLLRKEINKRLKDLVRSGSKNEETSSN